MINQVNTVFIAFGGNLGKVKSTFISARQHIEQLTSSRISASSLLYCTPPLGPPGQPDYLNAVIGIETGLTDLILLDALQRIEAQHGRIRTEHWGARSLDLDIIAINARIIKHDRLNVPHPLMQQRQFVLRPLCDIAANWQHPHLKKTVAQLLQTLLQDGEAELTKGVAW